MSETENATTPAAKPRGRPFQKGNPGKPVGAKNRSTVMLERMLDGQAEAIVEKLIELGLAGDARALRICMDRLLGARQGRTVQFDLPPIKSVADVPAALSAVIAAVGDGQLTPGEANDVAQLISTTVKAYEMVKVDEEIKRLQGLHLGGE